MKRAIIIAGAVFFISAIALFFFAKSGGEKVSEPQETVPDASLRQFIDEEDSGGLPVQPSEDEFPAPSVKPQIFDAKNLPPYVVD